MVPPQSKEQSRWGGKQQLGYTFHKHRFPTNNGDSISL
jgi:hypothetical protein